MRTVYAGSCKKGCQGPVLRTLQRFGALGRRSNGLKGTLAEPEAVNKKPKDCRCLPALSCNSRCLHVNNFGQTGLEETVHCMGEDLVVSSINAGNVMGNACIDTSALWHCMHGIALDHTHKKVFQVEVTFFRPFYSLCTIASW